MKAKPDGTIGTFRSFQDIPEAIRLATDDHYAMDLEYEVQVAPDKAPFKIIPCTACRRPIVVNTFYVRAWAKCDGSGCSGKNRDRGSVGVAQAGKTEPELAANLIECLINPGFAHALCPAHPDNPDHEMELKSVNHNDGHGPGEWRNDAKGGRIYVQIAKGETVMHQCVKCNATVSYSTTAQHQFKRINEPRAGKDVGGWGDTLGVREEEPPSLAMRMMEGIAAAERAADAMPYDGRDGSLEHTDTDREFMRGTDWENA